MAEARSRDRWAHTSALIAMTVNCHRDAKKSRPFKPADFDPHELAKKQERVSKRDAFMMLKSVFVEGAEVNRKGAKDAKLGRRRKE